MKAEGGVRRAPADLERALPQEPLYAAMAEGDRERVSQLNAALARRAARDRLQVMSRRGGLSVWATAHGRTAARRGVSAPTKCSAFACGEGRRGTGSVQLTQHGRRAAVPATRRGHEPRSWTTCSRSPSASAWRYIPGSRRRSQQPAGVKLGGCVHRPAGISVPRGNGKSYGGAVVGLWRLLAGQDIISAALDYDGAKVVMDHARGIIRAHPALAGTIEVQANGLYVLSTGSRWTITSREHTASRRRRPSLCLYDAEPPGAPQTPGSGTRR